MSTLDGSNSDYAKDERSLSANNGDGSTASDALTATVAGYLYSMQCKARMTIAERRKQVKQTKIYPYNSLTIIRSRSIIGERHGG